MRPGPSDQALETPLLFKLQGWGVVLVDVLRPVVPRDVARRAGHEPQAGGRRSTPTRSHEASWRRSPFSEENQLGVGCVRCHGNELQGGVINALDANGNPILAYPPNLTTICGGPNTGHPTIFTIDDIFQVI